MVKRWDNYVTPEMASKSSGAYYKSVPATVLEYQPKGFLIKEANRPGDNTNLPSSQVSDFYVPYVVPSFGSFIQAYEYYRTIGKVQNVVDSVVANIINREWYFESDKPSRIKMMEDWEEKFDLSRIFEAIVRDWMVFGNSVIGYSDWQPLQMTTILGIKRDIYGRPEYFVQTVNGKVVDIDAKPFLFTKFIEMNRDAWGLPWFNALISSNYTDLDGKQGVPYLQIYRQAGLDCGRILHRYGSPRMIYAWPGANREVVEKDIKPVLESMRPGDRAVFNELPTLVTEAVDTRNRFENLFDFITKDTEAGLQSSANRLITDPSAMADAKEAGAQDDDRVLGLMEKLRRVMNKLIIPRIVGESGVCFFKWGAKDSMELEFPQGLLDATTPDQTGQRIVGIREARMILSIKGWKLDDGLYQQDLEQQVWPSSWMMQGDPSVDMQKYVSGMQDHIAKLTGKTPTPQDYNADISDTDTNITGQGDSPPYRGHNFLTAGSYANVMPPNATKRGDFGSFGGSLASSEKRIREMLTPESRKYAYIVNGELIFRGGARRR